MFTQRLKSYYSNLKAYLTRSPWLSLFTVTVLATGTLTGIKLIGGFQQLELFIFDKFTQIQPNKSDNKKILVVEITEQDIQTYGWPLSDHILTNVLAKLQAHQPTVIGLDLHREIPHPPGTENLRQQLQEENIIAIQLVGDNDDNSEIPAPLVIPPERIGFNDLLLDNDGVVRRSLLFVKGNDHHDFYSFALRVALASLESKTIDFKATNVLQIGPAQFTPLQSTSGGYQGLDYRGYQMLLRYRSGPNLNKHISITQLLSGNVNPEDVQGKIVLIGTTAPSIKDLFYTPYSISEAEDIQMPGVVVHGQIISQILDAVAGESTLYWFWPQWIEILWLGTWSTIGVISVWRSRHPLMLVTITIGSVVSIFSIGWLSFTYLGWLPMIETSIGLLVATGLTLSQRLFYNTSRDQLTGLLNQASFLLHLQTFVSQQTHNLQEGQEKEAEKDTDNSEENTIPLNISSAVLYLNLDRFKLINGSLGLRAGNQVLRDVVHRLREHLPLSGTLARVGGDEFALLLRNVNRNTILQISDKIQASFTTPFLINNQNALISASIGIAFIEPHHHYSADHILQNAQTAMHRAKSLGKAQYEVFADGMFLDIVNRLQLESDLLKGIQNDQFQLYYQPIICLQTGYIKGFESLVRWNHPEQGFISPGIFIPIAEETGLILQLGLWIFQEACQQLKAWEIAFPNRENLVMSINLSSRQFEQADLIDQLQAKLKICGMDNHADAIKLEITESMVMGNVDKAIDMMLQLKRLNFKLSIDDFGTGYSSLSYLHRFPIDTLKIDQSFVRHMEISSEDCAIVDTIITLGHKLNMDVIAEGIETEAQMHQLHALGCEYGQGYFFARPLPSEQATALLKQNPQWSCSKSTNIQSVA